MAELDSTTAGGRCNNVHGRITFLQALSKLVTFSDTFARLSAGGVGSRASTFRLSNTRMTTLENSNTSISALRFNRDLYKHHIWVQIFARASRLTMRIMLPISHAQLAVVPHAVTSTVVSCTFGSRPLTLLEAERHPRHHEH
jgi:hypothetical protein